MRRLFLEAMDLRAPIVASDTAPVREVMRGGVNGWMVGFFDVGAVAKAVLHSLGSPNERMRLGAQSHRDVQRYELCEGVRGYDRLLCV